MFKVIPFGYRCSVAGILKESEIRTESYPFDWVVSRLDTIKDCIDTNFIHFLNHKNYIRYFTETSNTIDGVKQVLFDEKIYVNTYYETNKQNVSTYDFKLALTHHDIHSQKDKEYFERCVSRLYDVLNSDIKKYYIHFYPIMGPKDLDSNKESILNEFEDFSQYIITKTNNVFGLYFLFVKNNQPCKTVTLKESPNYSVFIIYCDEYCIDTIIFPSYDIPERNEVDIILKKILV